jgi:hypothetical protein
MTTLDTARTATPVMTDLVPVGDTPGLIVYFLDHGDNSVLIIGDDQATFAHTVELDTWPAEALTALRAHAAARRGGVR